MEQPQKDPLATLKESIKKFSESYKGLSPAGKAAFQKQLEMQLRKEDDRTKKLYEALIEATKNEAGIEKTIQTMEKADRLAKHGI
ncbi:MAG: hypothetical protein WC527_01410 [Candidatus Margulisiibacteriota bacterium]